jgi:hypothetical protein
MIDLTHYTSSHTDAQQPLLLLLASSCSSETAEQQKHTDQAHATQIIKLAAAGGRIMRCSNEVSEDTTITSQTDYELETSTSDDNELAREKN